MENLKKLREAYDLVVMMKVGSRIVLGRMITNKNSDESTIYFGDKELEDAKDAKDAMRDYGFRTRILKDVFFDTYPSIVRCVVEEEVLLKTSHNSYEKHVVKINYDFDINTPSSQIKLDLKMKNIEVPDGILSV